MILHPSRFLTSTLYLYSINRSRPFPSSHYSHSLSILLLYRTVLLFIRFQSIANPFFNLYRLSDLFFFIIESGGGVIVMISSLFARGIPPLVSLILLLCCYIPQAQAEQVTSFKSVCLFLWFLFVGDREKERLTKAETGPVRPDVPNRDK